AALNDEKHTRDLSVIGETEGLIHKRQSGPGRGGHRTCSSPASADDHARRSDLVFRLYDSVSFFALLGLAKSRKIILHGFRKSARWSDRIPTNDGGSAIDRPQCRRGGARC